jgi:inosose dehydratase
VSAILVGCGQLTWRGVEPERVLAEIKAAGYDGAPAGARSGLSAQEVVDLYRRHGLRPAPTYLGAAFWEPSEREAILRRAAELTRFTLDVGCTELYVAPSLTPERRLVSGHVRPDDALSDDQYRRFADVLSEVGALTLREGVRSCFHNHVGAPIETRAEIDRLFGLVDRSVVFQGVDIGHLAWAGDDPVRFCRDYGPSIKTMHLKDIDPGVRERGRLEAWDYRTFSDNGIFAELGEGLVDFLGVFAALRPAGFAGWVVVETDVTRKSSAFESARISREYGCDPRICVL